jgi:hypothetical protein
MASEDAEVKALKAFASGVKPNQAVTAHLYRLGYIEVSRVTNHQSTEEELLATFITDKGRKLMEKKRS